MIRRRDIPMLLAPLLGGCARPGELSKVRVVLIGGQNLTFEVAKSLGYFGREGLDVQLDEVSSAAKAMEALLGGSVDVAGSTYGQLLHAVDAGRDVKSFFVVTTRGMMVLVAAPGKPHIKRIEDLRGGTVGVASLGAPTQIFLSYVLRKRGIPPEAVTAVAIGGHSPALAALEHGKVDAAFLNSLPFGVHQERRPGSTVLLEIETAEGMSQFLGLPEMPTLTLVASASWLANNGETARRMSRAMAQAARWIRERPIEEVVPYVPESLRKDHPAAAARYVRVAVPSFSIDGRMPLKGPESVRDYLSVALDKTFSMDLSKTYTGEFLEANP